MAEITLPQLGETVTEGTITRWFKKVGDTIAADEPLFEVSTDKVDTEFHHLLQELFLLLTCRLIQQCQLVRV